MVTLELNAAQDRRDFVVELLSLESTLELSWQICQAEKFFRNPDLVRMVHRHLDCKFPGDPNVGTTLVRQCLEQAGLMALARHRLF